VKPETANLLLAAAKEVEAAMGQLDRSVNPACGHCGTITKTNKAEWQMAEELEAVARKLRNFGKKLAAHTESRLPEKP
jgi:hypothetical protein